MVNLNSLFSKNSILIIKFIFLPLIISEIFFINFVLTQQDLNNKQSVQANLNENKNNNNNNEQKLASLKDLAINKAEPSYINLKSILEHQEALELECAKYHDEKIKYLEELIKFKDNNEKLIHLPKPLQVKVPAVCLFLFGSFGDVEKMLPNNNDNYNVNSNIRKKLDIVNWIYNEDELRNKLNLTNGNVKREVDDNNNNDVDVDVDINNNDDSKILKDFFYDSKSIINNKQDDMNFYDFDNNNNNNNNNNNFVNKHFNEDEMKLHKNMDKIINDDRFKKMIDKNREKIGENLSPIILIPGLLGSRLQARTNKVNKVNIFCHKQSDWQDLWLSMRRLLPLAVDCWLDNVRLEFNPKTGYSMEPAGVESRVPDFGSVESVRYLDLNQPKLSSYMAPLIERYELLGYTIDKNLLAAPYDFRLAPQELDGYFNDLKLLIEKAQNEAIESAPASWLSSSSSGLKDNKKITLVCHSMGCTHALIFLRKQTKEWRKEKIRKLIALSSPWGGAIKALKALVVGDQLDLPLISEIKMRKLARTYPSISYLLPQANVFNKPNSMHSETENSKFLVQTPEFNYKVNDLTKLLNDLKLYKQLKWFNESSSLIKPMEPIEDLKVDCIHSLNTPTPETLIFKKQIDFPNGDYQLIKGEGDGTVNLESLMVCSNWATQLPDKVNHKIIMNTNHLGVLSHKLTLTHITDDTYIK